MDDKKNEKAWEKIMLLCILSQEEITASDIEMMKNFSEEGRQEVWKWITPDTLAEFRQKLKAKLSSM